jgi:hypothetical protein
VQVRGELGLASIAFKEETLGGWQVGAGVGYSFLMT